MRALQPWLYAASTACVLLAGCCMFGPTDGSGCNQDEVEARDASAEVATRRPLPARSLRSVEKLYERARMQEENQRFAAAVRNYDELLALDAEYVDARERRDTLVALIELAEASYATAVGTADPVEARSHLELIRTFWPGYRDVEARLAALDG
jgi:hypothetical protein